MVDKTLETLPDSKNDYEKVDDKTIAIMLKDSKGKFRGKALIDVADSKLLLTPEYHWIYYEKNKFPCAVSLNINKRIYLDSILIDIEENQKIIYKNKNTLDYRRKNLKVVTIVT